ncbi:membrane-associated RING finger protein, putative [Pediculus humanus corporis]|uniref:Membrane-associated RING finger protein, putative n=1 Tax=Pediculus humanus subsp. corporis TaxID=121224 RepID=E0VDM5_PEDHC|nr:membrane-associated RING finger protein, putative [Pediculus humanus corporis]EEB11481.1 membrane-associated RING finger protein, putative [Pediculus humanus corporis]
MCVKTEISREMGLWDLIKRKSDSLHEMTENFDENISVHVVDSEIKYKTNGEQIPFCRICQSSSSPLNQLISPCNCKGTLAYVHFKCLERWLNCSSRISCELCHFQYDTLKTRRYTLYQSLRLWIRHPVNWRHLQTDLFKITLFSFLTITLILTSVFFLEYFIEMGLKYGLSASYTKGIFNVLLGGVTSAYTCSTCFLINVNLKPWYYWWKNTHNIHLRIKTNFDNIEDRKKLFDELSSMNRNDSVDNISTEENNLQEGDVTTDVEAENVVERQDIQSITPQ